MEENKYKIANKNTNLTTGHPYRARWACSPWKETIENLGRNGNARRSVSIKTLVARAPLIEGFSDLRGIDLGLGTGSRITYEGGEFSKVDFSYALTESGVRFQNIVFRNCCFSRSIWWLGVIQGCTFHDCTFDEAIFYTCTLGNESQFYNCSFRGVVARGESFSFGVDVIYRDCIFEDIQFENGGRCWSVVFENCLFSGLLKDTIFTGQGSARLHNWKNLRNLILYRRRSTGFYHCDMEQLHLRNITFESDVIFKNCRLPKDVLKFTENPSNVNKQSSKKARSND